MYFKSLLFVLATAMSSTSATILTVEEGVYSRVTAAVTEDVPRQFCHQVLQNLQAVLTSTSRQLYESSGGRGRFRDVTVILPPSWAGSECVLGLNLSNSNINNGNADFSVSSPHPIFGSEPLARQFGQCGTAAEQSIRLPFPFLTSSFLNSGDSAEFRVFQEWVRSRYGVFPESGFADDDKFPEYFQDGRSTGGNGEWKANLGCANLTTEVTAAAAKQRKSHMAAICGPDHHDRLAPTKQNLLCEGRSATEVMLRSPDFASVGGRHKRRKHQHNNSNSNNSNSNNNSSFNELFISEPWIPEFNFALPSSPQRLILVLDISQQMNLEDRWSRTRDALFRLISHLPPGSEFGLVTFDSSARVNIGPTAVNSDNKEGLYGRIPYRLSSDRHGCSLCGLEAAMELLGMESAAGTAVAAEGMLLLVSSSPFPSDQEDRMASLRKLVQAEATPVYHVFFGAEEEVAAAGVTEFGKQFLVAPQNLLQQLSSIFLSVLASAGGPQVMQCYQNFMTWSGKEIKGTFRVEEELRKDLWVVLTSAFKEDVEMFEVISPSGKKYSFPQYDYGIVYFNLVGADNEAGIWSYAARLHHTVQNGGIISVEVFGERTSDTVTVRTWTNVPINGSSSPTEQPVILYAELLVADLPVQNAKVVALVSKPGAGGGAPVEVILRDTGTGYPDVTARDGVYSAYLADYSSVSGFYRLSIRASDNDGAAQIPKPFGKNGFSACCGSKIPDFFSVPTQPFERFAPGPSFRVAKGVQYFVRSNGDPKVRDAFPPSRVTDLHVVSYANNSLYATLSWTAPGGDFDQNVADKYDLRCYKLSEDFDKGGIPVHESLLPKPEPFGVQQSATVSLPWANEVFYYALVAVDEAGNRGKMSNLAMAHVVEVTTTTIMEMTFRVVNTSASAVAPQKVTSDEVVDRETMVYLIAGAISAFVLILSVIFFVAVCRSKRRRRRHRTEEESHPRLAGSNSVNSDLTMPEKSPFDVWKTSSSSPDFNSLFVTSTLAPNGVGGPTSWPYALQQQSHSMVYGLNHSLQQHQYSNRQPQSIVGLPLRDFNSDTGSSPSSQSPIADTWGGKSSVAVGTATSAVSKEKKPGSDTTASTDCSDSDQNSDKNVYNVPSSRVTRDKEYKAASAAAAAGLSAAERKRRQESLV